MRGGSGPVPARGSPSPSLGPARVSRGRSDGSWGCSRVVVGFGDGWGVPGLVGGVPGGHGPVRGWTPSLTPPPPHHLSVGST